MNAIGRRLRGLRQQKKLSQKEFGKVFDLAESTIGMYERDERKPDYETLSKIADYFEVSTDYLLGRIDQPFQEPLLTVTGPRKRPPYKSIGMMIQAKIAGTKSRSRSVAESLEIDLFTFNELLAGEIAPTEKQAEILAALLNDKKESFLPEINLTPEEEFEAFSNNPDLERWYKDLPNSEEEDLETLKQMWDIIKKNKK